MGVILDDFGSGSSSLRALKQFPIEALKIDGALIGALLLDRAAYETVELILLLARNLKLKVIAEGVETEEQLRLLHSLNCDEIQGYLLSNPIPRDEFAARFLSPCAIHWGASSNR